MIHGKTPGKVEVPVTLETGEVRTESLLSIGGVLSRFAPVGRMNLSLL